MTDGQTEATAAQDEPGDDDAGTLVQVLVDAIDNLNRAIIAAKNEGLRVQATVVLHDETKDLHHVRLNSIRREEFLYRTVQRKV
jgi:hypothetical protein